MYQEQIKGKIWKILGKAAVWWKNGKIKNIQVDFEKNWSREIFRIKWKKIQKSIAHRLIIERGRYMKLKVEDRLCTTCNVIEDEIHVHKISNVKKSDDPNYYREKDKHDQDQ